MTDRRRPRWVYAAGSEPDPRFSLANERTFLAWIRTALALLAAAVAVDALRVPADPLLRTGMAVALGLAGLVLPVAAALRWARAERALREERPLPGGGPVPLLAVLLVAVAGGVFTAALSAP
jgi:putative membrane protein